MTMTSGQVGFDDVIAAREILREDISVTPMLHSWALSDRIGGPVFLKCENLQRTGSFKARGAYVRISRLTADERSRGVVAASAGNHAQGVAFAAALLGTKATVVMPEGAPLPKIAATRSYGAEVVLHGTQVEDALACATELAGEQGAVFIHPFEHPDVVAGQGTVGLEIVAQCRGVRTIVVPVGGGGLAAGIAIAARGSDPSIRVVGVQAEAVAPVLSGGNIDPLLLAKVLRHGLSAAGRYLTFRCRLPDRPGALATLLAELAGLGANVLDVVHARFTPHLRVDEVEVQLQVETRGPGHCDGVIGQLRKAGYTLIFG